MCCLLSSTSNHVTVVKITILSMKMKRCVWIVCGICT